jgi:predicted RNA-binding Zn-ribbon protein involved in translation (DUF1610 family)
MKGTHKKYVVVRFEEEHASDPSHIQSNALLCPRCGEAYLHHSTVSVFERGEDDDEVLLTRVNYGSGAQTSVVSNSPDNPSSRRNGVVISFSCENCGPEFFDAGDPGTWKTPGMELCLAQHKGMTFLYWRYMEPKA